MNISVVLEAKKLHIGASTNSMLSQSISASAPDINRLDREIDHPEHEHRRNISLSSDYDEIDPKAESEIAAAAGNLSIHIIIFLFTL